MDLASIRRMVRANSMDTDNKSHRSCARWDDDKRIVLQQCACRMDGTATLAAKMTGMSVSACRREAKRLGIALAPASGEHRVRTVDAGEYLRQYVVQHLAISCSQDYVKVNKVLSSIHKTKVKRDHQLIPQLKEYWEAAYKFRLPEINAGNYKINDINDGVLKQYHRKHTVKLLSHMLRASEDQLLLRCRELGTACKQFPLETEALRMLLYSWNQQGLGVDDLVTITRWSKDHIVQQLEIIETLEKLHG